MPPTPAIPIAVTLKPSEYPYRFTELVAFHGDFDLTVRPGEVVNPKGIAYHSVLDRLLVSLSPFNVAADSRSQVINTVAFDGSRARFAPSYGMFRSVESKIAIVPESGPPVVAGFTPGDLFIGRGPQTEISRLSKSGDVISDVFAQFGPGGGFWGGICFDIEGDFDGQLLAAEANGKIYLIKPDGSSLLFVDLARRLEGLAVAPATFGPHAKNIIVGVEGYSDIDPHGGEVHAIDKKRAQILLANIGYAAEEIQFIPPLGGTLYQTQLAFDRVRENRLFSVSSSQFLNRLGRMIVVNEMTGELWEVGWNGTHYTQQGVGRVPGRWSTSGFNVQGTELEAGCFAVKRPRLPNWSDWEGVPGGFTTDRAPAAVTDVFGRVVLFSKSQGDSEVYLNSFSQEERSSTLNFAGESNWSGWVRDPQQIVTPHALACALHNHRLYAFAVRNDGRIVHKYYTRSENEQAIQAWEEVPGGLLTNTSVGCATVNGRLVLCALGTNSGIYLNELAPGGRYWSGWYAIPGGGTTDVTPGVVMFQDELYILIKGHSSNRILLKARTADGDWTPWGEVPGSGLTDGPISPVASEGQLFLLVKGLDLQPYINVASETGTWSGWSQLPNGRMTDTSIAAATLGSHVVLFLKGVNDRKIYARATM
jgi:hypothetical protein